MAYFICVVKKTTKHQPLTCYNIHIAIEAKSYIYVFFRPAAKKENSPSRSDEAVYVPAEIPTISEAHNARNPGRMPDPLDFTPESALEASVKSIVAEEAEGCSPYSFNRPSTLVSFR